MKKISVAHSPDADDIFMYMAIKFGWVSSKNLYFENTALDIETLNEEAIKGIYDVSAISFALYPFLQEDYALLSTAMSFGDGYGPKLVKKKGNKLKRNFKVALSGKYTTNALIFKIFYPEARIVYKNFLEIENSVLSGEVDAGLLIHESILDFDKNLECEKELWDLWQELVKNKDIPLPLGAMVIRRSLPLTDAIQCEEILKKAIKIALDYKPFLSHMLMERNLIRVNKELLDKYLNLYANENSYELNKNSIKAINLLFKIGYEKGLLPFCGDIKDYILPVEYKQLRFS